jgi:hypothetical protein
MTLATDAEQFAAFKADKDKSMQAAGLSSEEQALVKGHDEGLIRQYIQEQEPDAPKSFPFVANGVSKFPGQEYEAIPELQAEVA